MWSANPSQLWQMRQTWIGLSTKRRCELKKIMALTLSMLIFSSSWSSSAVVTPQIQDLQVISTTSQTPAEVRVNFATTAAAGWTLTIRNICTKTVAATRSGTTTSAKQVAVKIAAENFVVGAYEVTGALANAPTATQKTEFSVGISGGSSQVVSVCESASRLVVDESVKSQSRASIQLSKGRFLESPIAVLVGSDSQIGTTAIAAVFANRASAPLLISPSAGPSKAVFAELSRLNVSKVVLIGNESELDRSFATKLRQVGLQSSRRNATTLSQLAEVTYRKAWKQSQVTPVYVNLNGPEKFILQAVSYANANDFLVFDISKQTSKTVFKLNSQQNLSGGLLIADKITIPDSPLLESAGISRIAGNTSVTTLALATASRAPVSIMLTGAAIKPTVAEVVATSVGDALIAVPASGLTAAQKAWLKDSMAITQVTSAATSTVLSDSLLVRTARFMNNRQPVSELPEVPLPEFPAAVAPPTFAFSGAGLGHGIGMSQWGAYQMATEGKSTSEILLSYYTNSEVQQRFSAADIWVSLFNRISRVSLRVKPVTSGAVTLDIQASRIVDGVEVKSSVTLTQNDTVTVAYLANKSQLRFTFTGNPDLSLPDSDSAKINWSGTRFANSENQIPGLIQIVGPSEAFTATSSSTAGRWYRFGQMQLKAAAESSSLGAGVQVSNRVRFNDEYLYGLGEVPSSWPTAALEAQVIAARSYAYYDLFKKTELKPDGTPATNSRSTSCDCHIVSDIRAQNYVGWSKIAEGSVGARWKAAVDATIPNETDGLVVVHQNKVAQTFYSAANGGATQNNEDVWGGTPLGYLRSVPDPGSILAYDVVGRWSPRVRSQATLAAAFGLSNVATIDFSNRLVSGASKNVTATSTTGQTATITADQFRLRVKSDTGSALGSNWFHRSEVILDSRLRQAATSMFSDRMLEQTLLPATMTNTAVVTEIANLSDPGIFAAAASFAGINGFAFLPVNDSDEIVRVRKFLTDRGITSVVAVGEVSTGLLAGLRSANFPVTEYKAASADAVATQLASASGLPAGSGVVFANPENPASLPMAVSLSVRTKRPLLLANTSGISPTTALWLGSKTIGKSLIAANVTSIPDSVAAGLTEVERLDLSNLAAANRRTLWLGSGAIRQVIVTSEQSDYQLAVIAASTGAPLIYPTNGNIGYVTNWLRRQPLVSTVINAGAVAEFVRTVRQL
jgi:SpoIID/LytB domain protein